jgi:hypothetical protein
MQEYNEPLDVKSEPDEAEVRALENPFQGKVIQFKAFEPGAGDNNLVRELPKSMIVIHKK